MIVTSSPLWRTKVWTSYARQPEAQHMTLEIHADNN